MKLYTLLSVAIIALVTGYVAHAQTYKPQTSPTYYQPTAPTVKISEPQKNQIIKDPSADALKQVSKLIDNYKAQIEKLECRNDYYQCTSYMGGLCIMRSGTTVGGVGRLGDLTEDEERVFFKKQMDKCSAQLKKCLES